MKEDLDLEILNFIGEIFDHDVENREFIDGIRIAYLIFKNCKKTDSWKGEDKMEREMSLTELFEDDILTITTIAFKELCKNDKDFVKMRAEKCELATKNKNINTVCYEKEVIPLNTEDVKDLVKWIEYRDELELKYEKQMLYIGIRVAYMMFKNSGLLKEKI